MKGISTVLAIVLIVIIVVALVGLTYTFATTLFGIAVTGAGEEAEAIIGGLETQFRVETVSNTSETEIVVYIRNVGTKDIGMSDLAIFLDGNRIAEFNCSE